MILASLAAVLAILAVLAAISGNWWLIKNRYL
jgi:hypothetical protein